MPGHMIEAECDCGWKRELRSGHSEVSSQGYEMAYVVGDRQTVEGKDAKARKLEIIKNPFLRDWSEPDAGYGSSQAPAYRCPSCGRESLKLSFVGLWD